MEIPTEAVVAETEATPEVVEEEPATPSHKQTIAEPLERPVPTLDPNFWSNMLATKREMDTAAKKTRYSNLVVFK
jgi:hypothetical protein